MCTSLVFTQSRSSITKSGTYCGRVPKCRTCPSLSTTPTGRVRNMPDSSTSLGHDAMSSQQIVYRIGIEFLQPLINLVGILDLCNILWRSQNLFAVQNCCHLLQGKGILLDGQGTMDGADAVCSPQGGVRGQLLGRSQPTNQLCNLNNIIDNSICNFKRRFFCSSYSTSYQNSFMVFYHKIAHFTNHYLNL